MFFDLVPNFGTGVCVIGVVIPSIAMLGEGGKRIIIAEKRDTGRLFCVFCRVQRGKPGNGGDLQIYKICTALIVLWNMSKLSWRLK